jgi:tetratricopeptide (TPR) repeat protein
MNQHATLEPMPPRAEAPRRKDDRAAGGSAAQSEVGSPNGGGDPLLGKVRACLARQNALCAESELKRVKVTETLHSAEYHQLRADTLRLQNRLPDALGAVRRAIDLNAVEPRYWIMQGELQQQSGDQISAIQSFLQATKLEQRSPAPLYHIGMSFFILARHENSDDYYARARRHFELALKADAGYSRGEFMLGIIDAIQNRLSDARLRFERALQLEPRNPFYQLHYGVLLNRSGDDNGALAALTEAERIDPGYAPVHLHLGKLYSRLGRYAEARSELESASKLNPNLADAHYSLGSVYRHLGMTAMSQQAYQQFQAAKRQQLAADPVESVITAVPAE